MRSEDTKMSDSLHPLLPVTQNPFDFNPNENPRWKDQITLRGLIVSVVLGTLFCILVHRLSLSTGMVPTLNIAAALLSFSLIKTWTFALSKFGFSSFPLTRQENTMVQTCIVACYGLATSGGFGTYLLAMDSKIYKLVGVDHSGNNAEDVKDMSLGWIIGFLFVVSFFGIFSLVAMRKMMIIDYRLTYPSGTATAMLINSFSTNIGQETAGKQVSYLTKFSGLSFVWSLFRWVVSGIENSCGFDHFPSLGLTLYRYSFYFDFNPSFVGCGMICPHNVNVSILLGAIVFNGFLVPYISKQSGFWYPSNLHESDLKGLGGYKVLISVALILGDGLYSLVKILVIGLTRTQNPKQNTQKREDGIFIKGKIPSWISACGFIVVAIVSTVTIPRIFPPVKWHIVLISCVISPILAFCNSYGMGLTDMSMLSTYGKVAIFGIASLVGEKGGVTSGLAMCGIVITSASAAADLMQDFRTGYLTLSSPRAMFVSQLVGTAMGCVVAPSTFWLFWTAFDIGSPDGPYKAPYAVLFRQMAIMGVEGFALLPKYSVAMFFGFLGFGLVLNVVRDVMPKKYSGCVPIPMAMAITIFVGANFGIDMFVGTLIVYVWMRRNKKNAEDCKSAVASGLICGDGLWTIPSAIFSILRINPPFCMQFEPSF